MSPVEIEVGISQLADQVFEAEYFPYSRVGAFGNKETTIRRFRAGASNQPDLVFVPKERVDLLKGL